MLPFKVAAALLLATAALPRPAPAASFKTLHSFTGGTDGAGPYTAPIFLNGMLYGATTAGGTGCGSCGTNADGINPTSLIYHDGMLYGTTGIAYTGDPPKHGCIKVR